MKLGVVFSATAHAALLTWGLVSFSAPPPLAVADVEALPIDIVPIEELTKAVQGDRSADLSDAPAPKPTSRPETVENAENIGEARNDLKSEPEATPAEQPVEAAKVEAPPPAPKPTPAPKVEPEVTPAAEDAPAPTTELAARNEEAVPVSQEPKSEEVVEDLANEQIAMLQRVKAVPTRRPEQPKAKTAETQERKKKEEPVKTTAASSDKKPEKKTDEIASLLNKQKPTSSGAKRSKKKASLGTKKKSTAAKLSSSEMDAIKGQLAGCWTVPIGAAGGDELTASVEFELDHSGKLTGKPRVTKSSGNRAFDSSAVRAIRKCDSRGFNLPKGKYDAWREVTVNFDPRDMF